MQKKYIIYSIIFSIATIFLFVWFLFFKSDSTDLSDKFTINNISKISKITIENNKRTLFLTKNDDINIWQINNKYQANNKSVKKLIQAVSEVKVQRAVAKQNSDSILNIIRKKIKKITFYDNDKIIKTFYLSEYDQVNKITYALLDNEDIPYIISIPGLENNIYRRYNSYPLYWISPEIFKYKPSEIKEIRINYLDSNKISYKIEVNKNIPKLFSVNKKEYIENVNNKNVANYLSYFMNVKFSDFNTLNNEKTDSLKKTVPEFTIFVKDIYKNTKKVELHKIKISNNPVKFDFNKLYAVINNEDIVVVRYFDFDLILKDIKYFTK